jgi:hypothetical protein
MSTTEKENIQDAANRHYRYFAQDSERRVRICLKAKERGWYEVADSIRESILEDPLSLSIDEIDPNYDEVKWNLLLGWGGPAVRILVTTDLGGSVQDASYQFQDWFQPWTDAEDQDTDLVKAYAEMFYYAVVGVTLDGERDV